MTRKYRRVRNNPRVARNRLFLALALIGVAAAVVIGVVIAKDSRNPLTYTELPFSAGEQYLFTGRGYLYISGTTLGYYDLTDDERSYEATLPEMQINLAASSSLHAVYNATAAQIVGAENSILFPGRAMYVRCGDSHFAAMVEDLDTGELSIMVYDKNGSVADTITFGENDYPSGFGFYTASVETFWVMSLNTTGSVPVTTISTYDMSRLAATGVMTVQRQLIGDVVVGSKGIFTVGTQDIIRFSHNGNTKTWSEQIYGWELDDCTVGSRMLFLLTRRGGASAGLVRLLSADDADTAASKTVTIAKPENMVTMFLSGERLYFVTGDKLVAYNASGKKTATIDLAMTVSAAEAAGAGRFLAECSGKMILVTIK